MPGECGRKCGSPQWLPLGAKSSNVQKRGQRQGEGDRKTCCGAWTSVLLPLASCLLSPLLSSRASRWHRGHRAPSPHSPCPESGPGGAAGAPTRPGPAQGSSVGLAAACSPGSVLSPSPAPREKRKATTPLSQSLPAPEHPSQPPPWNQPAATGLREATLSGVEIARSKRSRSKAQPSPTAPGWDPPGPFLPELSAGRDKWYLPLGLQAESLREAQVQPQDSGLLKKEDAQGLGEAC